MIAEVEVGVSHDGEIGIGMRLDGDNGEVGGEKTASQN